MDKQAQPRIVRDELALILSDVQILKRKLFSLGNECENRDYMLKDHPMKWEQVFRNAGDIVYKWEYEKVCICINDAIDHVEILIIELNKVLPFANKYPCKK